MQEEEREVAPTAPAHGFGTGWLGKSPSSCGSPGFAAALVGALV